MPIVQLFRKHLLLVIIAALVFAGNNAVGYMTTGGYIQGYATNPEGALKLDRGPVLWAVAGSAVTWLLSTLVAGWISDRIGRRSTYIVGWILQLVGVFTLFPLVNTGQIGLLFAALAILTIGLGFTYGPQAALYTELAGLWVRPHGKGGEQPWNPDAGQFTFVPLMRILERAVARSQVKLDHFRGRPGAADQDPAALDADRWLRVILDVASRDGALATLAEAGATGVRRRQTRRLRQVQ